MNYGYARASKDGKDKTRQEKSPHVQEERINKFRADCDMEGPFYPVVKEWDSATMIPYTKRKNFMRLLGMLRRGDTLIVWRLDRIDRHGLRLAEAMTAIAKKGVRLYEILYGPQEIDLSSYLGIQIALSRCQGVNNDGQQRSDAIRGGMQANKDEGLIYCGKVPYGKERIIALSDKGRREVVEVWNTEECMLLCELHLRKKVQSWQKIAKDWHERRLRRQSTKKLWAPSRNDKTCMKYRDDIIENAYQRTKGIIESQQGIGGIQISKVLQAAIEGKADWALELKKKGTQNAIR
jgi:DNA invertase Pin-like site-specific DNA recombinase